jgi:Predicted membrane protein (DUF2339)
LAALGFLVLIGLIVVSLPFILPIVGWVVAARTRRRVAALETVVLRQADEIERLASRLQILERAEPRPAAPEAPPYAAAATAPAEPPLAEAGPAITSPIEPAVIEPPPVTVEPPTIEPAPPPAIPPPAVEPVAEVLEEVASVQQPSREQTPAVEEPAAAESIPADAGAPGTLPPTPPPPPVAPPPSPGFDWENLIGVKLFAGIAGIALVLAAVFFLRYSIDQGWLQPPVRVGIGVLVSLALLVLCELKTARDYPATANALDGAAIAILFATFFAAHSLWNLISAPATFILLAIVTAVAVLLSIRRESLFIAVLGLLGGFATPALVSTGENRPIPLFAYLLLLNVGLAWVAYRQVWPVLTWLTLALTTFYQLVWVVRFLEESSLSLAMGIFLVFPLAAAVGLTLGGSRADAAGRKGTARSFERTAMLSAGVPLIFAGYLASVPAYGAHAALLLGFLVIVDAGLLAIAIARRQLVLHSVGGLATLVVMAVWLATSYVPVDGWRAALVCTAAFVVVYLGALPLARWFDRPFESTPARVAFAAPLVLFVFPVLAAIEPTFEHPLLLFGTLLALLVFIGWRAAMESAGSLHFVASFFAIAAQAVWSAVYLTEARLRLAVAIYAIFGIVSMATPVLARRAGRPLLPVWGSGVVLLTGLFLLAFVSLGPVSGAALWALALLLAIMNAGLFIESASGGLPRVSQIGSLLSWGLLAMWWPRAAGSVGVLPSLMVMSGLTLITLAGHAWTARRVAASGESISAARFSQGLYLAVIGHLFLMLISGNREWSLPPWPIFGALAVMTLATSATSLVTRTETLHAAGVIAAALVVFTWAGVAGSPAWGLTIVLASAAVSAFALAWIPLDGRAAAIGAAIVLFIGDLAVLSGSDSGAPAPFLAQLVIHVLDLVAILTLTARHRWRFVALAAVIPAWMVLGQRQSLDQSEWRSLLVLATSLYAVFVAYPIVLGSRARADRDPYLAAVLASAMFFFAGRQAFEDGGLGWAVGVVPVGIAAVLAFLLRNLLRLQPPGERDIGRLALVAGAALGFVTVAIPLQLDHQWITIGWALEGAAMVWLYLRIPHRGLFYGAAVLLLAVFVRLAINPAILFYEPRGSLRIFNWYLYTYLVCAAAMFAAAWWLSRTEDRPFKGMPRMSSVLPAAGVILLFLLLNIEIADFYSTGPTIVFRFGSTVSQDLTYTIGWLAFGILLLAAGISSRNGSARITAVALIAVTTLKCFAYDLSSLRGLYLVASLTGLAVSLVLVSLALKKYVLSKPKDAS